MITPVREGGTKVAPCFFCGFFARRGWVTTQSHDYAKTTKKEGLPCEDRRLFYELQGGFNPLQFIKKAGTPKNQINYIKFYFYFNHYFINFATLWQNKKIYLKM
jgi:hypothetical protein